MSLTKVFVLKTVGVRINGAMKVLKPSDEPQQVPSGHVKDLVKEGLVSKTDPNAKPKSRKAAREPAGGDDQTANAPGGDEDLTNDSKDQANV